MADKKNLNNQYIIFKLGKEEFGIEIKKVVEIQELFEITRVPKTPEYFKGVINLRGEIIPVIDTRKRLNLQSVPNTEDTRIIVLDVKESIVGIVVDSTGEVLNLEKNYRESLENFNSTVSMEFILGICKAGKRIITILNMDKIVIV